MTQSTCVVLDDLISVSIDKDHPWLVSFFVLWAIPPT